MKTKYSVRFIIAVMDMILFVTFIIGSFIIGGTAAGGKVENGKYYIWDIIVKYKNGVNAYIEVSKPVYVYSTVHFYLILFVSIYPLIMKIIKRKTTIGQE
jgi:hypothetical protein